MEKQWPHDEVIIFTADIVGYYRFDYGSKFVVLCIVQWQYSGLLQEINAITIDIDDRWTKELQLQQETQIQASLNENLFHVVLTCIFNGLIVIET